MSYTVAYSTSIVKPVVSYTVAYSTSIVKSVQFYAVAMDSYYYHGTPSLYYTVKSCLYFTIVALCSPHVLGLTVLMWIVGKTKEFFSGDPKRLRKLPEGQRRTVLIATGPFSKTLHVARILARAGHTIIVADFEPLYYTGVQWSKYVDRMAYVPGITEDQKTEQRYIDAMVKLAMDENIDWFIPVSHIASAVPNTRVQEILSRVRPNIKTLSFGDHALAKLLDNKVTFSAKCRELGLPVADFHVVHCVEDLQKLRDEGIFKDSHYFMKPVITVPFTRYRSGFTRIPHDLKAFNNYAEEIRGQLTREAFFVCKFISGPQFLSNALCREGQVLAIQVGPCSSIHIDYDVISHPDIRDWTMRFCSKMNITGFLCFDFIQDSQTGQVYCIECNPRLHSSIVSYGQDPRLASIIQEVLEPGSVQEGVSIPLEPALDTPHVYWLYQEVFRLCSGQIGPGHFVEILWHGREAVWDADDPLPFLMFYTVQLLYPLAKYIVSGNPWERVNPCIGIIK
ncbi:uncharacterized protein LOC116618645 [Nematostella vectensis]|uniref:uncharacterized protein LOC116618645 n=1 Tax=Nematostella vectensis TaxID=45351 RepID=UPI0020773E8B|nr:uncharacterized protein LOC116618645 [Nematostella vectensis]